MKYVQGYFKAFRELSGLIGSAYLFLAALTLNPIAIALMWCIFVVSVAGIIAAGQKKNEKTSVNSDTCI